MSRLDGHREEHEDSGTRLSRLIEFVNDIETRLPVDRWEIAGVRVWPIIRLQLYFSLRDGAQPAGKIERFSRLMVDTARFWRAYRGDSSHNVKPSPADVILLGDHVSRIFLDGAWYDRLCEPIMEHYRSRNRTVFHMDPHHLYRIPRHAASMFIQPGIDRRLVASRIASSKLSADDSLPDFQEFWALLAAGNFDFFCLELRQIIQLVRFIRLTADYFKKIARVVLPTVAFSVEYYCPVGMAFMLACHELGVTTVEIPHGHHGDLHVAYSRWRCLPANGYELLPDIFWCWSKQEADTISLWSCGVAACHRPVVGGNPWLDSWRDGKNGYVAKYDKDILAVKEKREASIHILVTYEPTMVTLPELIATSPGSWRWWIRLHPGMLSKRDELKRRLRADDNPNLEIDRAVDTPLYALLRHMDVHVTEFSSTVIEAEAFGVPSVIVHPSGTELFPSQIASGWAVVALTGGAILTAIHRQAEKRSTLQRPIATGEFGALLDSLLNGCRQRSRTKA